MPTPPLAVAFDVLETLIDLKPLHQRFTDIGLPAEMLQPWFLRFQRDCIALALSGDFGEFYAAARQALRTESGQSVTEEQIDHVLGAIGTLPAYPAGWCARLESSHRDIFTPPDASGADLEQVAEGLLALPAH